MGLTRSPRTIARVAVIAGAGLVTVGIGLYSIAAALVIGGVMLLGLGLDELRRP